jgi:hypothetical protein
MPNGGCRGRVLASPPPQRPPRDWQALEAEDLEGAARAGARGRGPYVRVAA